MPAELLHALDLELTARGLTAWLVGGTVRDRLLARPSPDVDVVVDGDPGSLAQAVAIRAGRPWFPLSHEFGAYRVVGRDGHLDVTGLRGGSLEADLSLRDFTINAMAEPAGGGDLIDPYGGERHLREAVLVPVSHGVFADDPLRLMRAARFLHVLEFAAGSGLEALVRAEAWRLTQAAPERVLAELVLTLDAGRAAAATCLWRRLALLGELLPEVEALAVRRPAAYRHTLAALEVLDDLLARPGSRFGLAWELLESRLRTPADGLVSRPVALRLAALLHETAAASGGRDGACARLRCSQPLAALVATVSREWRFVADLDATSARERDRVAFLWRVAPYAPEVLLVAAAHALAAVPPMPRPRGLPGACGTGDADEATVRVETVEEVMALWRRREEGELPPFPLDGRRLMAELALPPGPLLGEVLQETKLAWEAGELPDEEAALAHAAAFLARRRGGGSGAPG